MVKNSSIVLLGIFWTALAVSAPASPLEKFIADREFCAYMAAPPENDSDEFLERYQAAIRDAVLFLQESDRNTTETRALFSIKAECDKALNSMLHYK